MIEALFIFCKMVFKICDVDDMIAVRISVS